MGEAVKLVKLLLVALSPRLQAEISANHLIPLLQMVQEKEVVEEISNTLKLYGGSQMEQVSLWWGRYKGIIAVASFITLFVVLAILIKYYRGTTAAKDWGDIISNFATAAAVTGGAIWALNQYQESRFRWPRLIGKQSADFFSFDDDNLMCRIWVDLENKGNTLIILKTVKVKVCQVLPIENITHKNDYLNLVYNNNGKPQKIKRLNGRWIWPIGIELKLSQTQNDNFDVQIEPGEQDRVAFDLLIPRSWELIEVCTDIENREDQKLGWKSITLHNIPSNLAFSNREIQRGDDNAARRASETKPETASVTTDGTRSKASYDTTKT